MIPAVWIFGAGLGALYLLTRKREMTLGNMTLKQGAWYRIRGQSGPNTINPLAEATALLNKHGFRNVMLSTQDPTNPRLWSFVMKWSGLSSSFTTSLLEDSVFRIISIQEVEEPPLAKDNPPTPQSLDAHMPFEDAVATAYALGRENDPKHLNSFANTLVPDYPIAASLLVARAKLLGEQRSQPVTSGEIPTFFSVAGTLTDTEISETNGRVCMCGIDPSTNMLVKLPVPKAFIGWDPFGDLKEAAEGAVEFVSDAASSIVDVAKKFSGEMADVITSAYDRFPLIKDFAASKFGETFIRAWSAALRNSPALAMLGPVGAGVMLCVSAAPLMATYDEGFWESLAKQLAWEVQQAASILGVKGAEDIVNKILPNMQDVIKHLQDKYGNVLNIVDKIAKGVVVAEDLAKEMGIRVDTAQLAIDFLKGQVPDLSRFDLKTGLRKIDMSQVGPQGVSQKSLLAEHLRPTMAKANVTSVQTTLNPAFAKAVLGLGKTVEGQWREFSGRVEGGGWPSLMGKRTFKAQLDVAQATGAKAEDLIVNEVSKTLSTIPMDKVNTDLRFLISKLVSDKKLSQMTPQELAKATGKDVRLCAAAIATIGEFPNDIRLVNADVVRRLLPLPPKPVSSSAVSMISAMSRPGRTLVENPLVAKDRLSQVKEAVKEGDPDAKKAIEELKRASKLLERRKWVEQYKRLLTAEKSGDITRIQGNLTGSFFGA